MTIRKAAPRGYVDPNGGPEHAFGEYLHRPAAKFLGKLADPFFQHPAVVFRRQQQHLGRRVAGRLQRRTQLGPRVGGHSPKPCAGFRTPGHHQDLAPPLCGEWREDCPDRLLVAAGIERYHDKRTRRPQTVRQGEQLIDILHAGAGQLPAERRDLRLGLRELSLGPRHQGRDPVQNRLDRQSRKIDVRHNKRLLVDPRGNDLGPGRRIELALGACQAAGQKETNE